LQTQSERFSVSLLLAVVSSLNLLQVVESWQLSCIL
jgi:hypothetical protein